MKNIRQLVSQFTTFLLVTTLLPFYASAKNYKKRYGSKDRFVQSFRTQMDELAKVQETLDSKENQGLGLVILVGDQGVGKTTLINFMRGEKFRRNDNYDIEVLGNHNVAASSSSISSYTTLSSLSKLPNKGQFIYIDLPYF